MNKLVLAPSFRSNRRNQAPQLSPILKFDTKVQQLKPIPQRQPKHLPQQKKDWFLTTPDGFLAARISDGLTIGENRDGELQFNPSEQDKIFYFELDADSDDETSLSIRMVVGAPYMLLRKHGNSDDHLTLAPWQSVTLNMPGGSLAIYQELAGRKTSTEMLFVELVKETDATGRTATLAAIRPNATEQPEAVFASAETGVSNITVDLPTTPPAATNTGTELQTSQNQIPDIEAQSGQNQDHRAAEERTPADAWPGSGLSEPAEKPVPAQPLGMRPYRSSVLLLIVNVLALGVLSWLALPSFWSATVTDGAGIDAEQPVSQSSAERDPVTTSIPVAQEETPDELLQSIQQLSADIDNRDRATTDFMLQTLRTVVAADPANDEARVMLSNLETAPPVSSSTLASDPATATGSAALNPPESQPGLNAELQQIQALLNKGLINSPVGDNAVSRLRRMLLQNPENPAVLAMAEQCADRLVGMATLANQQARPYEARNLLEEALSLAPEHATAKTLWQQWVGS